MEKEKRIKREENRIKKIFREVEENRKRTVEGLIKRAAFMRVSLEEFETEEKCLLYVALTRARVGAYVTCYGTMSNLIV